MYIYTSKNLIDVLSIEDKKIEQCGINVDNIKQIFADGFTHSFLEVVDLEKYNSSKKEDMHIQTLEERNSMIIELEDVQRLEQEEIFKKTEAYKISILEAENETLKESLKAILRGDMQTLAYNLYPEYFTEL